MSGTEKNKEKKKRNMSFWKTLPGVLTALVALVTAMGGCIIVMVSWPRPNAFFPSTHLPGLWSHYSRPDLGFAVDYPSSWTVTNEQPASVADPAGRTWARVSFTSDIFAYGEQIFGYYGVTVEVAKSLDKSLTETVAYELSPIVRRDTIKSQCCSRVGDQWAMEVRGLPGWGWSWDMRQLITLVGMREYRLSFPPQNSSLSSGKEPDKKAKAAFEKFLQTFQFILP
jgi:hypothetical protein